MFIKNLFLSTLGVVSLAAAQNSKACQEDSNLINSKADLDKIASCQSLSGDFVIGEDFTETLSLGKLESIGGNFKAANVPKLSSINMPVLKTISGEFQLQECEALTSIVTPALTKVGQVTWITLPALSTCNAKIGEAGTVRIKVTQLTSLSCINLKTVKRLEVDNNQYLKNVSMNLKNVSEAIAMGFNAKDIAISFPDLIWCNNITLTGAGSISLPVLQKINGSMNVGNTTVTSIACKNLTSVEQTLAFIGNEKVTELNFPLLTEIGGAFKIHNNSKLEVIDGFPTLHQVRGTIDFVGNFKNASLPKLDDVQGGFNLQTTAEFDCSEFDAYNSDQVIKGSPYTCKGKQSNPTTADGNPGADGNSTNSTDKGGEAGRVGVSALLGVSIAVIAFVF